jgi:hypothetical protein
LSFEFYRKPLSSSAISPRMVLKVSSTYTQSLVDIPPEPIPTFKITLGILSPDILLEALGGSSSATLPRNIGIAPAYSSGQSGRLQRLTLVAGHRALVLDLGEQSERTLCGRQVLEDLFTSPDHVVLAFDMAEAAAALYMEQGIQFTNFVDVQDMLPSGGSRAPLVAIKFGVECDGRTIMTQNIESAFRRPFLASEKTSSLNMVLRAWVAGYIATCAVFLSRPRPYHAADLSFCSQPRYQRKLPIHMLIYQLKEPRRRGKCHTARPYEILLMY